MIIWLSIDWCCYCLLCECFFLFSSLRCQLVYTDMRFVRETYQRNHNLSQCSFEINCFDTKDDRVICTSKGYAPGKEWFRAIGDTLSMLLVIGATSIDNVLFWSRCISVDNGSAGQQALHYFGFPFQLCQYNFSSLALSV